jgi:hypothetical protein
VSLFSQVAKAPIVAPSLKYRDSEGLRPEIVMSRSDGATSWPVETRFHAVSLPM